MVVEEWKDIPGYDGEYRVSNLGRVISVKSGCVLKPMDEGHGYLIVHLWRERKKKAARVHRLVAEAFVPNPEGKPQVNHMDCNRKNNMAGNLEWCTARENREHSVRMGRAARQRAVVMDDSILFDSIHQASRATGCARHIIRKVAEGRAKSSKGHTFKYV